MHHTNNLDEHVLRTIAGRIAAGDQSSFRLLFDHFATPLTEFAMAMLKSKDDATEVVDDVLVKIWKNRESLLHIENLRVYLYKATKNTALNYLSRKANEMITEPFDNLHIQFRNEECPEQQIITKEMLKKIHAAVNDLPPRCKMIFKLVKEDGLKYKEVAEILKISPNTVDAQMTIAIKKIGETLKGEFRQFPNPALKKSITSK